MAPIANPIVTASATMARFAAIDRPVDAELPGLIASIRINPSTIGAGPEYSPLHYRRFALLAE